MLSLGDEGGGTCVYVVSKPKDLPKLHRAVWKGDISKVKSSTNVIRTSVLNSLDKSKRSDSALPQEQL